MAVFFYSVWARLGFLNSWFVVFFGLWTRLTVWDIWANVYDVCAQWFQWARASTTWAQMSETVTSAYESSEQEPKHCLTWDFLSAVVITGAGLDLQKWCLVKCYSQQLWKNRFVLAIRLELSVPNLFLSGDAHPSRHPRFPSVATNAGVIWRPPPLLPAPVFEGLSLLSGTD